MVRNPNHPAVLVVLAMLLAGSPDVATAQESGTLLSQGLTVLTGTTNPQIGIQVAGGTTGKDVNTTTRIFLDFGPDGNASSPPPNPTLPAAVRFRITKSGVATPIEFTTTGGANTTDFPDKAVALARGLENTADPRGLFGLAVVHLTGVPASTNETYTVELVGLPAGTRFVAAIDQGTFTSLNTTGPCGGTASPCPSVCPVGQTCRGPCPKFPCAGPWRVWYPEIVWPRPFPPEPWPCLQCPEPWRREFDPREFERIMVTFMPTNEQRAAFERGQAADIRFNITGGQPVGDVLEGGAGEFMQLVQYPRGKPPLVSVVAAGATLGEFRAEPQLSEDAKMYRNLSYGLGVLLLGALAGIGALMRRGPGKTAMG